MLVFKSRLHGEVQMRSGWPCLCCAHAGRKGLRSTELYKKDKVVFAKVSSSTAHLSHKNMASRQKMLLSRPVLQASPGGAQVSEESRGTLGQGSPYYQGHAGPPEAGHVIQPH